MNLAQFVRERRGAMSIREAAKHLKISPTTLSKVERGHTPDVKTLIAISEWCGCRLAIVGVKNDVLRVIGISNEGGE